MKFLQNTSLLSIVAIALFISLLTGCGSHDDHGATPVGLVLSVGGTEIAMQEESTVTYASGNHIEINQGASLGPIQVEFISEGGERYVPDTNEGFSLQYSASNSNIISLTQGTNEWSVQLAGNVTGESTITFELWHNDHADFQSRPFQVRVISLQTE